MIFFLRLSLLSLCGAVSPQRHRQQKKKKAKANSPSHQRPKAKKIEEKLGKGDGRGDAERRKKGKEKETMVGGPPPPRAKQDQQPMFMHICSFPPQGGRPGRADGIPQHLGFATARRTLTHAWTSHRAESPRSLIDPHTQVLHCTPPYYCTRWGIRQEADV